MAKIAAAAFYAAGTLSLGTDEYTAHIDSAVLTPTTPTTTIVDISGQPVQVAGEPVWALALGIKQDLTTLNSLSQYLIANKGTKKAAVFTPKTGGKGFTIQALILPAAVGGAGGQVASAQVTLPCDGQPAIA